MLLCHVTLLCAGGHVEIEGGVFHERLPRMIFPDIDGLLILTRFWNKLDCPNP